MERYSFTKPQIRGVFGWQENYGMTKRVDKSAAVLTIREAPKMAARGRQQIARWLHRQADMLVLEGKNYSTKVFTARYITMPDLNQSSKAARKHMFKPPARSPRKRYGR